MKHKVNCFKIYILLDEWQVIDNKSHIFNNSSGININISTAKFNTLKVTENTLDKDTWKKNPS